MRYSEHDPAPELRGIVRCYWRLVGTAAEHRRAEPALPDGHPEFIVNVGHPFRARFRARMLVQPSVMLVGQITRPLLVTATGDVSLFAVRFEPHAAAFIQRPMSGITDRWFDASGVLPEFTDMRKSLSRGASVDDWIAAANTVLLARARGENAADERVARGVGAIIESHGMLSMEQLADQASTTLRHLQRLFLRDVGVSPKMLSQIRRFQRVFTAFRAGSSRWTMIAAECGYFDQAHLIRDFTKFAGGAPAGLLKNISEFTKQFTPLNDEKRGAI